MFIVGDAAMLLKDVISTAKYGELKGIHTENMDDAILSYIRLGMIELYKRFQLKTEEYLIRLVDGVTIYDLPDDYMTLIAAYEEANESEALAGITKEIPINETSNPRSVNTISYKQVQIPLVTGGSYVSLIYAAKPILPTENDMNKDIDLPDSLIEPLLHFIGYRAHGAVNGDVQAENNTHLTRFEASCSRAIALGLGIVPDDLEMVNRNNNDLLV